MSPLLILGPLHRLHGVGEHEHLEAACERVLDQAQHVRVHERLAAGEPDLARPEPKGGDLVVVGGGLGAA